MVRWKVKFIKAVRGPRAPVGDGYVDPMSYNDLSGTFAHGLGCGAILTSMFESLDPLGEETWRQWAALTRAAGGERAEVLNVYNLGFDLPEGHALRRGEGSLVFLFTSDAAWSGTVELRGLAEGLVYEVRELDSGAAVGHVTGPAAPVDVTMRRQAPGKPYWILLEARPLGATGVEEAGAPGERPAARGCLSVRVSPVPSGGPVVIQAAWAPSPAAPAASPAISVYDIRGREVRRLAAVSSARETFAVTWDGRDREGRRAASGLYFARVSWGNEVAVDRIVLAR